MCSTHQRPPAPQALLGRFHRYAYRLAALALLLLALASTVRAQQTATEQTATAYTFRAGSDRQAASSPEDLWTRRLGSDWPSFLGPEHNGKSPETGIRTDWDDGGLPIVWQRPLGTGYGIGSVSRGRYFQFDRMGDRARLACLRAETGESLWQFDYATSYSDMYGYDNGPRCSPVIDDDRVYILGVEGMLHCLRVSDGKLLWQCDTVRQFGIIQNFFGVGCTPVVEGDLLITILGGSPSADRQLAPGQLDRVTGNGSGIVAFDKRTGQVKYKITDELAGYASPICATIGERRWCFAFCRGGLVAFEPKSGSVDFQYPWRSKKYESVNASTPVVVGRQVFISETYGPGSALLSVKPSGYDLVWNDSLRPREISFQAHWSTPIHVDGYLYGCSGRNTSDAQLRCIAWETGKVQWSRDDSIHSSLLAVDGHAVCLEEYGRLRLLKMSPQRCEVVTELDLSHWGPRSLEERSPAQKLLKYPCWAAPILAHGLLFVRGSDRLLCLELIPDAPR